MEVIARKLTKDEDGVAGYIAHPAGGGSHPGIMLIHHNNGLTAELKIESYRFARLGYSAVVPNLYEMLGVPARSHIGQGQAMQKRFSDNDFVRVMTQMWQYLGGRQDTDAARTAVIGYCMGGRLAIPFVAATPQVRAFVGYYPTISEEGTTELRPRHAFDVAKEIKCPSMVLYGGLEHITTFPIQQKLWQCFIANGQPLEWHYFSYGKHGFASPESEGYQPDLALQVWPMVTNFLERSLAAQSS